MSSIRVQKIPICCILLLFLSVLFGNTFSITITGSYCRKNVSVKYQVPVTKTRPIRHIQNIADRSSNNNHYLNQYTNTGQSNQYNATEQYIEFEERTRWDTVHICCVGYRTLIFGFCEPICDNTCPPNSHCAQPNKCECLRGYEPSHHPHMNKEYNLICRPVCGGGCPEHSHCVGPNRCECRAGYKDVTGWWSFQPKRCERIQCLTPDQRYDVERQMCVKIEMSMEELMQRVGEKLAKGLKDNPDSSEEMDSGEQELNLK